MDPRPSGGARLGLNSWRCANRFGKKLSLRLATSAGNTYGVRVVNDLPGKNEPGGETAEKINLARILDEEDDSFCLEYPNRSGAKSFMRLEAATYEGAIREAKSYLGIGLDDRDEHGTLWQFD